MVTILQSSDDVVEQVANALLAFEKAHPEAECIVYRFNPASVRIRIVDSVFQGLSKSDRHDYALKFLNLLPDDVLAEVSILLCLEPGESSFLDFEFQDPSRSQL